MAIIKSVLGQVTQKLDNIRFSKWKNKNVLARMPQGYTDANSPAQQDQRAKFTALVQIARLAKAVLLIGFASFRDVMTWLNAFIQQNKDAVTASGGVASITFADLIFSKGSLLGVEGLADNSSIGSALELSWTNNSNGVTGFASDLLCVVVLDSNGNVIGSGTDAGARDDAEGSVTLDANYSGQVVHVYAFFENQANGDVSDTSYVTFTMG